MSLPPDDHRPTYVLIAEVLRGEIVTGRLRPGERLPSVRELSERYDIAAATAQSALRTLRDQGLIHSRSTRGYYVRDEPPVEQLDPATISPVYRAISTQLDALHKELRSLADRVSSIEESAQQSRMDGPHQAGR